MELTVNLRNAAQVFAAAGLATVLNAESRFEIEAGRPRAKFIVEGDIARLARDLRKAKFVTVSEANGVRFTADEFIHPASVEMAGQAILLDWWLNRSWSDKSNLKTWAGTSTPVGTLTALVEMIPDGEVGIAALLNAGVGVSKNNRPSFGFDPRTYSGERGVAAHHAPVTIYPFAELLSAIGLQFVRPVKQEQQFTFHVWQDSLPPRLTWLVGSEGLDGVKSKRMVMYKEKRSKGIFAFSASEFQN
jgi:hypothetical protein